MHLAASTECIYVGMHPYKKPVVDRRKCNVSKTAVCMMPVAD